MCMKQQPKNLKSQVLDTHLSYLGQYLVAPMSNSRNVYEIIYLIQS